MKNKNLILALLTVSVLFSFFLYPSIAIDNPDYIEIIGPGNAIYFSFNLEEYDELFIEFEVTAGANKDIDFYILNSENYDKWMNSESFSYYIFRSRAVYATIDFIAPDDDTFYVIFSNSFSIITSKTVEIDFTIISSSDTANGVEILSIFLVWPFFIIISIVIIILISLIIRYYKRQIPKEVLISEKQEIQPEVQNIQISEKSFCSLCGAEILDETGDYCSKCGGSLK